MKYEAYASYSYDASSSNHVFYFNADVLANDISLDIAYLKVAKKLEALYARNRDIQVKFHPEYDIEQFRFFKGKEAIQWRWFGETPVVEIAVPVHKIAEGVSGVKPTAGDWQIENVDYGTVLITTSDNVAVAHCSFDTEDSDYEDYYVDVAEATANAKLICAAKPMLAVLQQMQTFLNPEKNFDGLTAEQLRNKIFDVIQQATK